MILYTQYVLLFIIMFHLSMSFQQISIINIAKDTLKEAPNYITWIPCHFPLIPHDFIKDSTTALLSFKWDCYIFAQCRVKLDNAFRFTNRGLWEMVKGALWMRRLSPWRGSVEGIWEGELLHWGPWGICWRALVMGHHSSRNSIRGPGDFFTVEPERWGFERHAKCPVGGPSFP